jgi:hypothetical protein
MTLHTYRTGWRAAAFLAAGCLLSAPTPAFAGAYWNGFKKFWSDFLMQTDGVVLTALLVGAVSLFIITRGKWIK